MTISAFPPGMVLIAGAFLLPLAGRRLRAALIPGLPLAALWLAWTLPEGISSAVPLLGYQLTIVRGDALGRLFAIIFSLMAFAGMLFALRQRSVVELVAAMIYAGSAIGVVLAGDLITLFVFWESMALASSAVLLAAGRQTTQVAMRYFQAHMAGGALLMSGILMHLAAGGSIAFDALDANTPGGALILAGVLLNAAAPPLSAWLPDAYPEASYSGTVFLSAFTTKAAVCVLIRGFPGAEILIWVGLFMIFYGLIHALLENDVRRILAYTIINQVGFMVVGVGIGTEMALNGAAAHAFVHIIYKGLLVMSAGAVLQGTGRRGCADLGGLTRSMPVTAACAIIGALATCAFPGTSGFVSKSMIVQAAGEQHLAWVWFVLMAASAVSLHAGIRFPWLVFFHKDAGLRPPDPSWNMRAAMILLAVLCIGPGLWPEALYGLLPYPVAYVPYTAAHVVNMLQLLVFSGLAFFLTLPLMRPTPTITLDVDWFYRRAGGRIVGYCAEVAHRLNAGIRRIAMDGYGALAGSTRNRFGEHGKLARAQTVSSMITVTLLIFVIILLRNLLTL